MRITNLMYKTDKILNYKKLLTNGHYYGMALTDLDIANIQSICFKYKK